ncbi:iron-regulated membrane protein [Catenovulum agarivorans DS-2]|uniref:Iron-regulated membrane protein n=1 Tax=Catenovulum agarivorans DS-2 TaxID=1328313 RepID=W7QGS2_9ALTE|nr:PepSY-associated TM helix domain-containing protein [Catenovulum agarivorans]EWH11076.1 iron-regulated membrane protein [Catenovulum agarivorans DS-2]
MKNTFRQSMNWLHTWSGFLCAWLLYFIFLTGTLGYFENEIDRWLKPEMVPVTDKIDYQQVLLTAEQHLEQLATDSPSWYISFPAERSPFVKISWLQLADTAKNIEKQWHEKSIDLSNNHISPVRDTAGGMTLYRLHYNLHYLPTTVAYIIVSIASMFMLIGLITGIIIHKKIFIEFFTFRANKGLRSWLDIHNIFSVLPLPFHLMITYSGLVLLMTVSMAGVININYGEGKENNKKFYYAASAEHSQQITSQLSPSDLSPQQVLLDAQQRYPKLNISYIGVLKRTTDDVHYEVWFDNHQGIELVSHLTYHQQDGQVVIDISGEKIGEAAQIYDVLEHLHEGLFADIYLRWLYFLSGLMGSAMIATGCIIWLNKRLKNANPAKQFDRTYTLARLNIAVVVGLPIALAVFFYSNRLLPIEMLNRAQWEMHSLFITLGLGLIICLFHPNKHLWRNSLWLCAVSFPMLPLVNYLTTGHNLFSSFVQQDWQMFAFDLTMLITGAASAWAALALGQQANTRPTGVSP